MKYFKPKSLTWWTGFLTLLAGLFMATESIHGMTALADSIYTATGMGAPVLINAGLFAIGIRGAVQ